jgi:Flp pilus assembly protein TadG
MRNRAAIRSERGQSLTEFALVLPLLMLVLFGIIQFGITFNNYISLTDAVRSGARKAATSRSLSDPPGATIAQVRKAASDLKPADLQVTVESTWVPLEDVRVSASYPYKINLLGLVVASGRMTSTTVERVEQ